MDRERPIQCATLKLQDDIHHLVIEFVRGPAETKLVQLSSGLETILATGTQSEVSNRADELIAAWKSKGFVWQPLDGKHLVYEPLKATVALALRMGFRTIYDPRYKNLDPRRGSINATSQVPLEAWPGFTTTSGVPYTYAFDQMHLRYAPTLPVSAERELAAITDSLEYMRKAIELQKAQGLSGELLLGEKF